MACYDCLSMSTGFWGFPRQKHHIGTNRFGSRSLIKVLLTREVSKLDSRHILEALLSTSPLTSNCMVFDVQLQIAMSRRTICFELAEDIESENLSG